MVPIFTSVSFCASALVNTVSIMYDTSADEIYIIIKLIMITSPEN